ncbi:MAG: class I SAM-dependent methyltransferase [Phycisphaerales bacterium]
MPTANRANSSQSIIEPRRPHDDFSFEQLAASYNFKLTSDRRRVFSRLVVKECDQIEAPRRVLDIGCGRGIGRRLEYAHEIRRHIDDFWGIEPDQSVTPEEGLFDHFQHALMETAVLPEDHFDLAYSFMVMEHVADPESFMRSLHRSLRPGGVFLFMTPNGRHYFTRLAKLLHRLKVDELTLRFLKRTEAEDYQYPVQYRFNHASDIHSCVTPIGFDTPQFAYLEAEGPTSYFPGPLRPILWMMNSKRRVIQSPRCLLTLTGRVTKS